MKVNRFPIMMTCDWGLPAVIVSKEDIGFIIETSYRSFRIKSS